MFEDLTENITQGNLYRLAGRTDDVCTFDLREGSASYLKFGPTLTVELVYTQEERKQLEKDIAALDKKAMVKAKGLLLKDDAIKIDLIKTGIPIQDIISATALHFTPEQNTYTSTDKRKLDVLVIPYEPSRAIDEIDWWYGFMCRRKGAGDILMPEWELDYLACKSLSTDELTEEESILAHNPNVVFHKLRWKDEMGIITKDEKKVFQELKKDRIAKRLDVLKDELKKVGIPFNKFRKDYKDQAVFILNRLFSFCDHSLNSIGKYPLYMDFRSFLHIYLRHVEDVNMGAQMAQKDKFQLYEKDILLMIEHVMHELNTEYQLYRESQSNTQFRKYGDEAIYCMGDYYELSVDKDGRLETFYKASRNKKR